MAKWVFPLGFSQWVLVLLRFFCRFFGELGFKPVGLFHGYFHWVFSRHTRGLKEFSSRFFHVLLGFLGRFLPQSF